MVDTDILVHPIRRSYKLLPLVVVRRCPLFMRTLMSMSNKLKRKSFFLGGDVDIFVMKSVSLLSYKPFVHNILPTH
jgi:hypothetical protein